jgi:AraC-like DNA-binding protein
MNYLLYRFPDPAKRCVAEKHMNLSHLTQLATSYYASINSGTPRLPRLSVLRREAPSEIEASIYEPVMCLILQGSKVTSIGDQIVELHAGDALLVSHDLPVESRITMASASKPYLAAILSLDLGLVRSLYEQVVDAPLDDAKVRSLSAGPVEQAWLAPLVRYFELMSNPLDAKVLGPSIAREIHYRLLLSPLGKMLRNLLVADSHASRIAKAIKRLRAEFRAPLSVSDLAKTAGMSASSFHEHFKSVTGTSPLQYQKNLRLIAARALLVEKGQTVSGASYAVGYESPTHFSRDYSKKFGLPPSRDAVATNSALQDAHPALA